MSFGLEREQWPAERVASLVESASPADVERALGAESCSVADFAALLSEHARPHLEVMARKAQHLTRQQFGRTIGLYAPVYLSNVCGSDCVYCGFAARSGASERRLTLKPEEIEQECIALSSYGYRTVLLLTGDAPKVATVEYIAEAIRIARAHFASVAVEVYSLETDEYRHLCEAGLDGVTLYMETYDTETYGRMHLQGKKMDYRFRLDALERAGLAGVRKINGGALLGLYDWRIDGFWLGLHARYLQRHCWQSEVAVSFPRLRNVPKRFTTPYLVSDVNLVQLMLALRLFLPNAGFTLSTRETAALRDRLTPLGITMMSAGSSTRPGGYATCGDETLEQFAIEDTRSPDEVAAMIRRAGYDPVWKDFDRAFHDEAMAQPSYVAAEGDIR